MFHFYIPKSHGLSCLTIDKREPEETGKKPKDFILYDDLCSVIKHTVLKQVKDFTNDLMRSAIIAKDGNLDLNPCTELKENSDAQVVSKAGSS